MSFGELYLSSLGLPQSNSHILHSALSMASPHDFTGLELDDETAAINAELERIDEELKRLEGLNGLEEGLPTAQNNVTAVSRGTKRKLDNIG